MAKMLRLSNFNLIDIRINGIDLEQTAAVICEHARRFRSLTVGALAVHNFILQRRDLELRKVYEALDIVTTDGQFIRIALNLLYRLGLNRPVTARALMKRLCEELAQEGGAVYLYGDEPHVVHDLASKLRHEYPGLRIAGAEPSVFRPLTTKEDEALADRINASGAHLLFVALGCPLQEKFVARHRHRIHIPQICVGSVFKILAGHRKQAPQWLQDWCLEWTYHFLQDPRKKWCRVFYYYPYYLILLAGRFFEGRHRHEWQEEHY